MAEVYILYSYIIKILNVIDRVMSCLVACIKLLRHCRIFKNVTGNQNNNYLSISVSEIACQYHP